MCHLPFVIQQYHEPVVVLTPKPSPKPRINGAKVVGVRPGSPFLFTIAATGKRPIAYQAEGLPEGLRIDPATGIITGSLDARGEYCLKVTVTNSLGTASRDLAGSVEFLELLMRHRRITRRCFASHPSTSSLERPSTRFLLRVILQATLR